MINLKAGIFRRYSKVTTIPEAVSAISRGSTVLAGGFGVCGNPNSII